MKRKAIFLLYRVLQALAPPVLIVYLLLRGLRNPRWFSSLPERFGGIPSTWQQTASTAIWLHAVSVGEVLAALPLIEEIRQRSPGTPIFVSTSTLAGRQTADKRLAGVATGIFFAPLDFVWAVRRVFRRLRPSVLVILETEIWPNLFREANRRGCGILLVNGRISDRALSRYRRFAPLFRSVLELCDAILVQSEDMLARFAEAGAPAQRLVVGGNLKYDFPSLAAPKDSPAMAFLDADRGRPVWIAASTSADDRVEEETFVIAAQRALEGWRLIVAPRKPERFDRVAGMLAASGLRWTRRTALDNPGADVLLLDSIGELSGLFAEATVVFMGGTMADRGGHNILEPAIHGKPVIVGPHMENFREIATDFERRRAILRIQSGQELAAAVPRAAADRELGERAREAAEARRGAAARAADRVMGLYDSRYPCERPPQPVFVFLWLLSVVWKAASALDRKRKSARAQKLPVPVISVGNITTGGTGKTPLTIELLRMFQDSHPGMLTRGHGRSSHGHVLFLEPNQNATASVTGDEPQLCMRAVQAPIGIGSDRFKVGKELLSAADVKLLILDDGFQHLQLCRDVDLVLIDSLHPFGGSHLVPLGRLREPLAGLARASAFVITRTDESPNVTAIESVLKKYNPGAPIFRAVTVASCWHDAAGAEFPPGAPPFETERAVAFCGLGNPHAFWKTLRGQGIEPVACYAFEDHHKYPPSEIRRIAQHARDMAAGVLLTTAKDAVNLDPDYPAILGAVKLYWLEIKIEIDRPEDFRAFIRDGISRARS